MTAVKHLRIPERWAAVLLPISGSEPEYCTHPILPGPRLSISPTAGDWEVSLTGLEDSLRLSLNSPSPAHVTHYSSLSLRPVFGLILSLKAHG